MKRIVNSLIVSIGLLQPTSLSAFHSSSVTAQGKVIAFLLSTHVAKMTSAKNKEVVIARVTMAGGHKQIVKIIFLGFGPSQVSEEMLHGTKLFRIRLARDPSCDEKRIMMIRPEDVSANTLSSTAYVLNEASSREESTLIASIDCYIHVK